MHLIKTFFLNFAYHIIIKAFSKGAFIVDCNFVLLRFMREKSHSIWALLNGTVPSFSIKVDSSFLSLNIDIQKLIFVGVPVNFFFKVVFQL